MKNKILGLLGLNVLLLILLMGAVSAAITLYPSSYSTSIQQGNSDSFTFTIFSNGICTISGSPANCTLVNITSTISDLTGSAGTISSSQISVGTLPSSIANDTTSSPITVTITIPSNQALGNYNGTITVGGVHNETSSSIANKTISLSITVTEQEKPNFCEFSDNGNLKIRIKDVSVEEGFGKDNDWFPLDEVQVEVRVENDGNEKIKDIIVEWGLYNLDTEEWVIDDEESDFNLKGGDKETINLNFKLDDVDEFEENGDYVFFVWATGEDEEFDEAETCASDSEEIEIIIEDDFVILDNIEIPEVVQCGSNVQITANVWNIGDDDQEDVYVLIKSEELGINNKKIEIGDIDAFDSEPMDVTFKIPEDAEEKTYSIRFTVYDEDNDIYENDYDDDQSIFSVFLKVEGNCAVDSGILISASLVSEAKAGKEMVMSVLLTNTADATRSFTMEASGYDSWAELSELPGLLTLNKDSVGEVLLKLDLKKGISGEQTFLIMVYSDNELIATQPVSVNIESARPFLGITGLVTTDNAYLWGIGLLNIILIIIIILIAVRIARRK